MDAQAPFDSSAMADIILRSSDNIHFYVLGTFLYFVSHDQTFRKTLSARQGPLLGENETRGNLPIIDLEAHSEMIYIVLELIYPRADEPRFRNLDVFRKVCKTAQLYSMTVVEDKLKKQILASQFMKVGATSLAVALAAARETLQTPLKKLAFIDELQDISGAAFCRELDVAGISRQGENVFGSASEAQGPFGASPTGNIVLRSSDSVDFFVIEGLIRFVSPFFDRKFPLEKHEEGRRSTRYRCTRRQHGACATFSTSFTLAQRSLDIRDCHLYRELVRACTKFEMSKVVERLQKQGIALAVQRTTSDPLQEMIFVEELLQITGADLFRLMRYRFNCADAVRQVMKSNDVHTAQGFPRLRIQNSSGGVFGAPEESLVKLYQRLEDCPRGITYRTICASEVACRSGYHPSYCHINISAFDAMERYREGLVAAIEDAISKISLMVRQHGLLNPKPASWSSPAIQDGPSIEQTATSNDPLEDLLVGIQDESALSTKCKKCRTSKTLKRYKTMTCTCTKQNVVEKCLPTYTFGRTNP
ncbi:hypothetical protein F5887DRAFT_1258985 [Amanita rubescens]|nr:hypothetical protein F5887DRAFT_1258985 [Amanita rubescens]